MSSRTFLKKQMRIESIFFSLYDDIITPTELADVHYKKIITKRNQWIIDRSDIVIGYSTRNYGGANNAIKYAYKKGKTVLLI